MKNYPAYKELSCYTLHRVNNKGTDQIVQMHKLVSAFVILMLQNQQVKLKKNTNVTLLVLWA